jgi:hypothetical protein
MNNAGSTTTLRSRTTCAWTVAVLLAAGCIVHVHDPAPAAPVPQASTKSSTASQPTRSNPKAKPASRHSATRPIATSGKPKIRRRTPPVQPGGIIVAPPPKLVFTRRDLGTPHTAGFVSFQGSAGATLFPKGSIDTWEIKRYDGKIVAIDDAQMQGAYARAWIASGSFELEQSNRHIVESVQEITRCESVDDRTQMRNPPSGSVYYPAVICYGNRYEGVLSGTTNAFHAGLKAAALVFEGGLQAFAKLHNLQYAVTSTGLTRKPACGEISFSDSAALQRCFAAGDRDNETVVYVEWRVVPGARASKRRIAWAADPKSRLDSKCGGTAETCLPCQQWAFHHVTFDPGRKSGDAFGDKGEISIEVQEPNGAERTLRGTAVDLRNQPIIAKVGEVVTLQAWDKDVMFDDVLAVNQLTVQEYFRDGSAPAGRFSLQGRCTKWK